MDNILHRNLKVSIPLAVNGNGSVLTDSDGKTYIDACGGAAVSCLGHNNANVIQAIPNQLSMLPYSHSGFFTNEAAENLATYLVQRAPCGFGNGKAMFLGSGSEAMEAALKLARQFHLESGQTSRRCIISRDYSYHGNTLGALSISGHKGRRQPFEPLLSEAHYISPCYAYRFKKESETEEEYGLRAANTLEEKILQVGAENVSAFVAEPVCGATLGAVTAVKGYFNRIREICNTYGVLFIADEVMCGMGRTGTLFALEQENISADIFTVAKGLGAGYQPISAVLASERVSNTIKYGSGQLWNGHTYMSHASACAGSLEVLAEIERSDLLLKVQTQGIKLEKLLKDEFNNHPHVGDIRGRGLFWALELVLDKETKTPYSAKNMLWAKIKATAFEKGLMCYPAQGCVDGVSGDHVLLAPAYIVSDQELTRIVEILTDTFDECLYKSCNH